MTFKEGYRLEKVYFENIYTLLNMLKSVDKNNVDMNTVKELLDNAIADNESIILIYKNLGELYSEVADNYSKLLADLEALKENLESWKDEINEKIDDLNNYIMSLIRDIEQRLDSLEQRMSDAEEAIESLEDRMDTAEADIDALEGRMDTAEDDIDALKGRMNTAEDDIDSFEGRMDTAEDDIDDLETNKQDKLTAVNGITIDSNNEISVDDTVIQPKLTEGFGIDIASNNEIKVDTAQVQEKLIAGQNITLTPDSTDPTKTVIDSTGGSSYSGGRGISIDNNSIYGDEFPYSLPSNIQTNVIGTLTPIGSGQTHIKGFNGLTKFFENYTGENLLTALEDVKIIEVNFSVFSDPNNPLPLPTNIGDEFKILYRGCFLRLHDITDNKYYRIPTPKFYGEDVLTFTNVDNSTRDYLFGATNYVCAYGIAEIEKVIKSQNTYELLFDTYLACYYNGFAMYVGYDRGYTMNETNLVISSLIRKYK